MFVCLFRKYMNSLISSTTYEKGGLVFGSLIAGGQGCCIIASTNLELMRGGGKVCVEEVCNKAPKS